MARDIHVVFMRKSSDTGLSSTNVILSVGKLPELSENSISSILVIWIMRSSMMNEGGEEEKRVQVPLLVLRAPMNPRSGLLVKMHFLVITDPKQLCWRKLASTGKQKRTREKKSAGLVSRVCLCPLDREIGEGEKKPQPICPGHSWGTCAAFPSPNTLK